MLLPSLVQRQRTRSTLTRARTADLTELQAAGGAPSAPKARRLHHHTPLPRNPAQARTLRVWRWIAAPTASVLALYSPHLLRLSEGSAALNALECLPGYIWPRVLLPALHTFVALPALIALAAVDIG